MTADQLKILVYDKSHELVATQKLIQDANSLIASMGEKPVEKPSESVNAPK